MRPAAADGPISPALHAEVLGVEGSALLDVVIELQNGHEAAGSIAAAQADFARAAEPVSEAISASGGTVLEDAWLNHTLLARVPAQAVPTIAQLDGVCQVDLPHTLHAE